MEQRNQSVLTLCSIRSALRTTELELEIDKDVSCDDRAQVRRINILLSQRAYLLNKQTG